MRADLVSEKAIGSTAGTLGVLYDFWTLNEQVSEVNQQAILAGR